MTFKICKLINGNNDEWYHLKYKKWFLWHDVTERSGRFLKRFDTIEEVNKYIGLMTIKKVKCWDENHG